jgi:hypothetical protein
MSMLAEAMSAGEAHLSHILRLSLHSQVRRMHAIQLLLGLRQPLTYEVAPLSEVVVLCRDFLQFLLGYSLLDHFRIVLERAICANIT